MLQKKRVWLGLLITLFFLVLLLRQVELPRLGEVFSQANWTFLLPAVPLYFAGVWFRALRWEQLLAPLRPVDAAQLFPNVVIGYMANDLLPVRMGELVRAYLLGARQGLSKASILGTIALERLSDGLVLLAFMALIALFIPLGGWLEQVLKLMSLLFLGALAGLLLVLKRREGSIWLLRLLVRSLPDRLGRPAAGIAESFLQGMAALYRPGRLAVVALYAVLAWVCEAGVFYFVGLALDLTSPLYLYFLAMAVANLATTLPSSQAGIGPFEYFCAQTFLVFGTEPSLAAAYAVLIHWVLILPVTFLGLAYLWSEQLSLAQVVRASGLASVAPDRPLRGIPPRE